MKSIEIDKKKNTNLHEEISLLLLPTPLNLATQAFFKIRPYWNVLYAFPGSGKKLYCKLIPFPLTCEEFEKQILNYAAFIHNK